MDWIEKITRWIKDILNRSPAPGQSEKMVQELMHMLQHTRADEISCDEVFELLDYYTEIIARGEDAASLLPLIKHHLDMCSDCREEYEALLEVLEAAPS